MNQGLQHIATYVTLFSLIASVAVPQTTTRVSVDSSGAQATGGQTSGGDLSVDARYVAIISDATNLVPGDTNGSRDVFIHDRVTGQITRVNLDANGNQSDGDSGLSGVSISADGRYVAFDSYATNLVPGDTNGVRDVFVKDRMTGAVERASVTSAGAQAVGASYGASISADGRYVAFDSNATNLVPGDTNAASDVFVHDRQTGQTTRLSVDSSGHQGNGLSRGPSISTDGRCVAFESWATNLVPGDTNGHPDTFVHDRTTGQTTRISVDSSGNQGDDASFPVSISSDGRYVAFSSLATNLVPGDTNGYRDIFVHDRIIAQTTRVSVDSVGSQGNFSSFTAAISSEGRYVTFVSGANNLVSGDTNGVEDVFVHDRITGQTTRVSVDLSGNEGNGDSGFYGRSISPDGRIVVFHSFATNLVIGDTNGFDDAFVRDRDATGFTSLCDPGIDGVMACPCSNSSSGLGRGCDNSAATGGAVLSASGIAYLSVDSLVFRTTGERSTTLSIMLQGDAVVAPGLIYGQGIRCVEGILKRLYTKAASSGSITAPDFGAGDPTVSGRSAAMGDVIQAGQSRWYLVYYRDPVVLGGCPASSTFNATQTGQITWSL